MKYKFNEDKIIELIKENIDATYNQHYANESLHYYHALLS